MIIYISCTHEYLEDDMRRFALSFARKSVRVIKLIFNPDGEVECSWSSSTDSSLYWAALALLTALVLWGSVFFLMQKNDEMQGQPRGWVVEGQAVASRAKQVAGPELGSDRTCPTPFYLKCFLVYSQTDETGMEPGRMAGIHEGG